MKHGIIKQSLVEICEKHGKLEPKTVVEEASSPGHPLHNCFEWDDSKAGKKYRIWQARQLIVSIDFVHEDYGMQMFHNVKYKTEQAYQPLNRILTDEEMKTSLISEALKELQYWQRKYDTLSELAGLVNTKKLEKAIDKFIVNKSM